MEHQSTYIVTQSPTTNFNCFRPAYKSAFFPTSLNLSDRNMVGSSLSGELEGTRIALLRHGNANILSSVAVYYASVIKYQRKTWWRGKIEWFIDDAGLKLDGIPLKGWDWQATKKDKESESLSSKSTNLNSSDSKLVQQQQKKKNKLVLLTTRRGDQQC